MDMTSEKRKEQRLHYNWPMRFAGGFGQILSLGKMVDVSSWGGAFTCQANKYHPAPGQKITTLFSVPHFSSEGSYDMASYNRVGRICRVEDLGDDTCRIAVQFAEPLFFKPGEQGVSEAETKERLELAVG